MSSSISYEKCPHCGEEGSLVMELNCRTGEDDHFCMSCGYSYTFAFQRDEKGCLVRTPHEYKRADCFLGIRDYNTKEMLYRKPLTEIENLSEDIIRDWINTLSFNKKPDDTTPDGSHNVYCQNGDEIEQLFYIGNRITTNDNPDIIIVEKVNIIEETTPGHGIFYVGSIHGGGTSSAIAETATKEELIAEAERLLKEYGEDIRFILVTKFNTETKKLEEIFKYGSEPQPVVYEEEDEYPETDGEYENVETEGDTTPNDNLPF